MRTTSLLMTSIPSRFWAIFFAIDFAVLAVWLAVTPSAQPDPAAPSHKTETAASPPKAPIDLTKIKLPPGFKIQLYAQNVKNARSMALSPNGTLFVGNRSGDKVFALVDANRDNKAEQQITIASGLNMPNGVAIYKGALYVAEVNKIWRYDNIEANLSKFGTSAAPKPALVTDKLPSDTWHGWKYIAFGPDGKLYVPVGAPCNVCERDDWRYSSILRMNPDGSQVEAFAKGMRNTVGFAWHPSTKELWWTDNGRDMLGDNLPPDELNHAPKPGMHFGFPYFHNGTIRDPEFGKGKNPDDYTKPARGLTPHGAALGMKFYTGRQFPAAYQGHIFIAEHGSWNRSVPIGYRVMIAKLSGNTVTSYEVFAEGWLQGGSAWGRPVDVLVMPDGALLVSDDEADCIYRIVYQPE